ncbi:hypothetical protein UPYG_G00295860 [Umbra pygmaea]|uniref:Uncharacterized protein n=1 Tax=Umbra pygmaea TaxID=75934 RepID=A0ABD0W9S5_UMBPY
MAWQVQKKPIPCGGAKCRCSCAECLYPHHIDYRIPISLAAVTDVAQKFCYTDALRHPLNRKLGSSGTSAFYRQAEEVPSLTSAAASNCFSSRSSASPTLPCLLLQ